MILAATLIAGCSTTESAISNRAVSADPSGETLDDGGDVISFSWLNEPRDRLLLPGASLQWSATGVAQDASFEVILETPTGPQSICIEAANECWLPAELREMETYDWWIRTHTDAGIVRSKAFVFSTPAAGILIKAPDVKSLSARGGLTWMTSGIQPAGQFALIVPASDEAATFVCSMPLPCSTTNPLIAGERYAVEIRAYDGRGLYASKEAGTVQANRPPAPAYPATPTSAQERPAGQVRLTWSAPQDPEKEPVGSVVEYAIDSTWREMPTISDAAEISVPTGKSVLWRVRSTDASGNEVVSPFAHFHTPNAPPSALLASPVQGMRLMPKAPVTFEWIPQGSGMHKVFWRQQAGAWAQACTGETQCSALLPLAAGSAYDWKVETDAGLYGRLESAVQHFETVEPVVLVHGLLSSGATWGPNGGKLAADGYEVIDFFPDGGVQPLSYSPASDSVGIYGTANAVREQLDARLSALGFAPGIPIIIVGHSLGGLIGRQIAETPGKYPVSQLITVGTPHLGSTTGAIADDALPTVLKAACSWILNVILPGSGKACAAIAPLIEDLLKGNWDAVISDLKPSSNYLNGLNARPLSTEWRAIAGDSDMLVSVASATYLAVESRLVVGGHTSLTENAAVINVVKDWLNEPTNT